MAIYMYRIVLSGISQFNLLLYLLLAVLSFGFVIFEIESQYLFTIAVIVFIYSSFKLGGILDLRNTRVYLILTLFLVLSGAIQWIFFHNNFFIYMEPAHAARVLGGLSIFFSIALGDNRYTVISSLILILTGLITPSVSFLIYGLLLLGVYVVNLKGSFFIFIFIGLSVYFLLGTYFIDRIHPVQCVVSKCEKSDSGNLTSMVFLQGVDQAVITLRNNSPYGLGNAGEANMSVYGEYIREVVGHNLNLEDAGSVAAKLVIETAWAGVFVLFVYLTYFIKYAFLFVNRGEGRLIFSVYLILFPELFLRGGGYFSMGIFLFFCVLGYVYYNKFNH